MNIDQPLIDPCLIETLEYWPAYSWPARRLFVLRMAFMGFQRNRLAVGVVVTCLAGLLIYAATQSVSAALIGVGVGLLLGFALAWR